MPGRAQKKIGYIVIQGKYQSRAYFVESAVDANLPLHQIDNSIILHLIFGSQASSSPFCNHLRMMF
jgi:hypothetical protein